MATPHVRPLERRAVVNAVARHGADAPSGLHGLDQAQLVFRGGTSEDVHVQDAALKVLITHLLDVLAGQGVLRVGKAKLPGDGEGSGGMVAGHHDRADSGGKALLYGLDDFLTGRVEHAHQPQQDKPILSVFILEPTLFQVGILLSQCQHPQAPLRTGCESARATARG